MPKLVETIPAAVFGRYLGGKWMDIFGEVRRRAWLTRSLRQDTIWKDKGVAVLVGNLVGRKDRQIIDVLPNPPMPKNNGGEVHVNNP